jgi:hypothetical protein
MDLERELRHVWDQYATQRAAEADIRRTYDEAMRELNELNGKRLKAGLPAVSEYNPNTNLGIAQAQWGPPPRTWKDEMNEKLLAKVSEFLSTP